MLARKSKEYKLIEKYVSSTHGETHHIKVEIKEVRGADALLALMIVSFGLLQVFVMSRHGEEERFAKDIPNHQLLWHGSRLTNYVGILSQGLRIAPPEVRARRLPKKARGQERRILIEYTRTRLTSSFYRCIES